MQRIALALFCKTPQAGQSKTRLSPPLTLAQCADLSAAFICDVAMTLHAAAAETRTSCCAVYTPAGSERELRPLLPQDFTLLPQSDGDLGARLMAAMHALFDAGHGGVIFINADAPTLPPDIVADAVRVVRSGYFAIGPAHDGGYTLIGLPAPNNGLFTDIAWSTPSVLAQTNARAREFGLELHALPPWYDVDDAEALAMLQDELAGRPPPFADPGLIAGAAPATRDCLARILPETVVQASPATP